MDAILVYDEHGKPYEIKISETSKLGSPAIVVICEKEINNHNKSMENQKVKISVPDVLLDMFDIF